MTPTKLTIEQAVVLSGFTGVTCCSFENLHEEVEKRLGRPVWTHEFADEAFAKQVRELFHEDFLAMLPN